MARFQTAALFVAVPAISLALGACGSSKKTTTTTSSTPATTSPAGGVAAPAAAGANAVTVTLGDTKGVDAPMTLTASPASLKAGDISFVVKNTGTIEHEMVVLKTSVAFDQLPVVDSGDPPASVATGADKVDEEGSVGETGDPNLKPGDSRTFTVKGLAAGNYALVCNIAKHYGLGMRAAFTVS